MRHGHRARPGRHLEQPDWVAGTQDVSLRKLLIPLAMTFASSASDHTLPRPRSRDRATREPQSTSLPARTRARRSVETTVLRERAFVVVPDSILQGTMLGCPASTSGVGRNSTARPRADRRRACPTSGCGRRGEVKSNATEGAAGTQSCVEMLGRERVWCASSSRSIDPANGFCLASARHRGG